MELDLLFCDALAHVLSHFLLFFVCCKLRYFSSLDTDNMELELGDAQFAINRWSKMAVDVIGEMDSQEYDPTKFGLMEVSFFISDLFHFFILIQF